jgi:hypothetical protein
MARIKRRTMFGKPKNKALAKMVRLDSPSAARKSAIALKRRFHSMKTRPAKVATKRATVLASSRAKASGKKRNLSTKEKREFASISKIYKDAYKSMKLD